MKDSILEKALLQAKVLEEAIKTNAKGILADTMKQEINSLVKESLEDEMSSDEETDIAEQNPFATDDETDDEQDVASAEDDNAGADIEGSEEDEMSDDEESEDDAEIPAGDSEGFAEITPTDDDAEEDDDEAIDMTGASDDEVLKIFKKMGEDDGIIVTPSEDGKTVELGINDEEFLVKINEEDEEEELDENEDCETEVEESEDVEGEVDEQEEVAPETEVEESEDEEPLYEIVFDDDMGMGSDSISTGDSDVIDLTGGDDMDMDSDIPSSGDDLGIGDDSISSDVPMDTDTEFMETARTIGLGNRPGSLTKKGGNAAKNNPALAKEHAELKKQNKLLKEKVEEYKKALGLFRDKLNEVAVFNANLAYATRLFTEHSTTKNEKMEILKRFDETATLKESQSLYKTIKNEMNSKATVTENVANKIVKTPSNGSTTNSKEILAESKAYTSPQFERMKDLFNKLK